MQAYFYFINEKTALNLQISTKVPKKVFIAKANVPRVRAGVHTCVESSTKITELLVVRKLALVESPPPKIRVVPRVI